MRYQAPTGRRPGANCLARLRSRMGSLLSFSFAEEVPTNQSTTQREESFVDVSSFLVTDAEPAELIEPGESSLHNPTPLTQAATVVRVALC